MIAEFIYANLPDNSPEEVVSEVCAMVRETFGVQCDYACAGGFDSPGYEITCYAIAFVDEDGNLGMVTHTYEIY